ncbi:uncharacterized protein MONBRDRAFT_26897 [Monosiga brevicollis MX1]|uniref:BAH domain-containing protein n=1 Tax=Monosiga brevicollis TaxID=81824 RepID=A9V3V0_MONBE|nr:uncharacterized protein MONBRDRAFT_26897 [Monosiga brevicollis MX1]EDQ87772.1 predicted protein [Monosiga brevicollis MX1]|eukprot:XP_001747305.1 hypothetical protein [Monosiga brevicollis MX1]
MYSLSKLSNSLSQTLKLSLSLSLSPSLSVSLKLSLSLSQALSSSLSQALSLSLSQALKLSLSLSLLSLSLSLSLSHLSSLTRLTLIAWVVADCSVAAMAGATGSAGTEAAAPPYTPGQYRAGEYVLTSQWHDASLSLPAQLFVAHIEQIDSAAGQATLRFFYWPQITFFSASHTFYKQEVCLSSVRLAVPLAALVRHCAVLNKTSYLLHDVPGIPEADTFVCLSSYQPRSKVFGPLKRGHRPGLPLPTVTRSNTRHLAPLQGPLTIGAGPKTTALNQDLLRLTPAAEHSAALTQRRARPTPVDATPPASADAPAATETLSRDQAQKPIDAPAVPAAPVDVLRSSDFPRHVINTTKTRPLLRFPEGLPTATGPHRRRRGRQMAIAPITLKAIMADQGQKTSQTTLSTPVARDEMLGEVATLMTNVKDSAGTVAARGAAKQPRTKRAKRTSSAAKSATTPSAAAIAARASTQEENDEGSHARDDADEYFEQHHGRGQTTSDATLADTSLMKLKEHDVEAALQRVPDEWTSQREALRLRHEKRFHLWASRLQAGFNLLFYGVGSKKELLTLFAERHLRHRDIVSINGFFPSMSIKQVLDVICERHLGYQGRFRSALEQLDFIAATLASSEENVAPMTLLIHNIDGLMLRNDLAQTILSGLAALPSVSLVASIDHVNAPLLWDQGKLARFSFAWIEATTFAHYKLETAYSNSILSRTSVVSVAAAVVVMKSLTHNGRKAFWTLLQHQSDNLDNPNYPGLRFADYLALCQQNFSAHDEARLKAYMTEYRDHQLVTSRKVRVPVSHGHTLKRNAAPLTSMLITIQTE